LLGLETLLSDWNVPRPANLQHCLARHSCQRAIHQRRRADRTIRKPEQIARSRFGQVAVRIQEQRLVRAARFRFRTGNHLDKLVCGFEGSQRIIRWDSQRRGCQPEVRQNGRKRMQ
jgi:hypothetical protein